MPAHKTPPEVLAEALRLVKQHGGIAPAARAAGVPAGTFQSRYQNALVAEQRGELTTPPIIAIDGNDEIPKSRAFEQEWAVWMAEIGMAKDRYAGPAKPKARVGRLKILVVPDLHAPFHDAAAVAAMLEREKDIDIAVLMGDIGDGYSLSRFLKYDAVPYEQELASVTLLLQTFSERFPIVRIIEGNHDGARLEKQLLERLSADMITAIRSMTGGTLSPIHAICKRFPNIEFQPVRSGRHAAGWITQIGDALFTHAEKFSITPGAALRKIEEWLADQERTLELQPWRLLCQAHTHQMSWIPWHADKLLLEVGCLCATHGYQVGARIGGRPQRRGWVVLEQVDGVTDVNSVRIVWWDAERRD